MQSESVEHLIHQRFPTFSLSIFFFFFPDGGGEKNYGVFRYYIEERKRIRGGSSLPASVQEAVERQHEKFVA